MTAMTALVEPMKLRYRGEHHGDHPSWIYTAHVSGYRVRMAAPRAVVRKAYVVNPRTGGPMKQSTGIEELGRWNRRWRAVGRDSRTMVRK